MKESILPCNGCTECCKSDLIFIHEELGDTPSDYLTKPHGQRLVLQHKPNGDCIYLDKGCSIYANRPGICKELDCTKLIKALPKKLRYNGNTVNPKVVKAAKRMKAKLRLRRK